MFFRPLQFRYSDLLDAQIVDHAESCYRVFFDHFGLIGQFSEVLNACIGEPSPRDIRIAITEDGAKALEAAMLDRGLIDSPFLINQLTFNDGFAVCNAHFHENLLAQVIVLLLKDELVKAKTALSQSIGSMAARAASLCT